MDDRISRSQALDAFKAAYQRYPNSYSFGLDVAKLIVESLPDAEEDVIVRCQDCDYSAQGEVLRCNLFSLNNVPVRAFCAWGKERKK